MALTSLEIVSKRKIAANAKFKSVWLRTRRSAVRICPGAPSKFRVGLQILGSDERFSTTLPAWWNCLVSEAGSVGVLPEQIRLDCAGAQLDLCHCKFEPKRLWIPLRGPV